MSGTIFKVTSLLSCGAISPDQIEMIPPIRNRWDRDQTLRFDVCDRNMSNSNQVIGNSDDDRRSKITEHIASPGAAIEERDDEVQNVRTPWMTNERADAELIGGALPPLRVVLKSEILQSHLIALISFGLWYDGWHRRSLRRSRFICPVIPMPEIKRFVQISVQH
jgi:hypothetical protein